MTRVRHLRHGIGTVLVSGAGVATVEFDTGPILRVPDGELQTVVSETDALDRPRWDAPLATALKALALAIRSTNDRWGVFSTSRVALLPHQLWVCHRVLERWPSRWLIADDVGLGKTIEAGLILTPLLAGGRVKRLLVICPASLVEQWAERLRELFDIRVARYHPEVDKPADDFWSLNRLVVASMQTLRLNRRDRWARIFDAEPWDLVVVDEAHHLNADERSGRTLGLRLLMELDERSSLRGLLLFTGTPHRGKDFGFLSLLRLLDPQVDPEAPLEEVVSRLPGMMIRNNKQNVTNMYGTRLFEPPTVHDITYEYSPAEAEFYTQLTAFILTGRAYAAKSQLATQRSVMLVLTTLQKLAASSVAAVRCALTGRLARLRRQLDVQPRAKQELDVLWLRLAEDPSTTSLDDDERARLEERIDELMETVQLNPDEIPALEQLVALAGRVEHESRVDRLMRLVDELPANESILMFTEYKATQALVLRTLIERFGDSSASFINGDGFLDHAIGKDGQSARLVSDRRLVAAEFNAGRFRFLVSTEAAGEGIDLQRACHTLVHVDLPWNPMRMHQRVGRLNRYGQRLPVEVYVLRNPDTVEGRIWECLEHKLTRIGKTFEGAMADPEDIRELVLGMASPGFHERLATRALQQDRRSFREWYDAETASFNGESALATVRTLIGNTGKFDYRADAADVPRVDLPDLVPFLRAVLRLRGRRLEEREDGSVVLKTPDEWLAAHHTIRDRYHVHFSRQDAGGRDSPTLLGAGHRMFDAALADAASLEVLVSVVDVIEAPVWIFVCQDQLTAQERSVHSVVFGVQKNDGEYRCVVDWELVRLLNGVVERPDRAALRVSDAARDVRASDERAIARAAAERAVPTLQLPFRRPQVRLEVLLWPASREPEHAC